MTHALCSRNLKNVKLRPTVWKFKNLIATQFYLNQFWQNMNLKNCLFYNFWYSELSILVNLRLEKLAKLTKIRIQNLSNCLKWHLTVWICQNLISRHALTSHFESFWSIVTCTYIDSGYWWVSKANMAVNEQSPAVNRMKNGNSFLG